MGADNASIETEGSLDPGDLSVVAQFAQIDSDLDDETDVPQEGALPIKDAAKGVILPSRAIFKPRGPQK